MRVAVRSRSGKRLPRREFFGVLVERRLRGVWLDGIWGRVEVRVGHGAELAEAWRIGSG